jgi:hypothetical protein
MAMLTETGKAKSKAAKDNKKCIAYYKIELKHMKILCLLAKVNTTTWPRGLAWKVKKALVAKYRPDNMITVSEPKKHLISVTLKGNQDTSDLFEDLAAIEHAYSEILVTLSTQD